MFKVHQKLNKCKVRFIKWRKEHKGNSRAEIDLIQKEMDNLHRGRGERLGKIETTEKLLN